MGIMSQASIDTYVRLFLDSKLPPASDAEGRRSGIREMAQGLGISEKHLGYILSGARNLSTEIAEKLAATFGLTHIEMLLRGKLLHECDELIAWSDSALVDLRQTQDRGSSTDGDSACESTIDKLRKAFASRIRTLRGERTQDEMAVLVGTRQQMWSRWEKGEFLPTADNLIQIAESAKCSIDWLLLGKEERPMPVPELTVATAAPHLERFSKKHPLSTQAYVAIPLLNDSIAAGTPSEIKEGDLEGWALIYRSLEWMPHDPVNYTCAHIYGYSMYPVLAPGDIVAIDHAERDPQRLNNHMAVFREDGGVTVKWLRYIPERQLVIGEPENRDQRHATIYLQGEEIREGIVGKVAWWWAKR